MQASNLLQEATEIANALIIQGFSCSMPTLEADGTATFMRVELKRKGRKIVEERTIIIVKETK